MATEVVKVVDTGGGGDYSSLAAWEADYGTCTQANYPSMSGDGDLVGADLIAVADCRCSTGVADTDRVIIDGWTSTGADNYIKIWTDPDQGYRHDGKWNTSAYRLYDNNNSGTNCILDIVEDVVKVEGLQFFEDADRTSFDPHAIKCSNTSSSTNIEISKCIVKAVNAASKTTYGIHLADSGGIYKVWNNIIYGSSGAYWRGLHVDGSPTSSDAYFYSNTIYYGGTSGIDWGIGTSTSSGGNVVCKNNLVDVGGGLAFRGSFAAASDYNASSDGTAPGTNSRTNQTFTFADAINENYHLDSTDTGAKDCGTDLSSDPYLAFTDDIDGDTRSVPWDIGADEYVSGLTKVSSTVTFLFDIFERISSDLTLLYDIYKRISSDITLNFDILNRVSSDFKVLYDIIERIQSDLTIVFDIEATSKVISEVTCLFDVLNRVKSELECIFSIYNKISSDVIFKYDVNEKVISDVTCLFDIRENVESDLIVLYDMAGKVVSDVTFLFKIFGNVDKSKWPWSLLPWDEIPWDDEPWRVD